MGGLYESLLAEVVLGWVWLVLQFEPGAKQHSFHHLGPWLPYHVNLDVTVSVLH